MPAFERMRRNDVCSMAVKRIANLFTTQKPDYNLLSEIVLTAIVQRGVFQPNVFSLDLHRDDH
jgi:hypothetical protein